MAETEPYAPHTVAPSGLPLLIAEAFDRGRVTGLRHAVAAYAEASGLAGQRLEDFVLAVNELITNAVRHGGGQGWLRLWREDHTVRCEVSDSGGGIAASQLGDRDRPPPNTTGGRGLWLARQLSDDMVVNTDATGTTIQISTAVGDPTG